MAADDTYIGYTSWTYDESSQYFYGVLNAGVINMPKVHTKIVTIDGRSGAVLSTVNITEPVAVMSLDLIFD